jgi:membrane-bound lytic murein transglycosylase A
MVAQDTGSAIVGPARADLYFGAGDEAARMAGRIKNPGDFVMLLPRALDPVEAGADMPLPPERPATSSFNAGLEMVDPTDVDVPAGEPASIVPESKPAPARRSRKSRPAP